MRTTLTAVEDFRVHSVEFGTGEPPVVLVHGLAGSAGWWSRNVEALCADFRVIVPDLIGFGRTRLAGRLPDLPRVAEILGAWAEAVGLDRFHLVGHSMGGQICVHLATAFPERIDRLILVDAAGIPRPIGVREMARSALQLAPPRTWGDPFFFRTIASGALVAGPRTLAQAIRHIVRDDVRPLLPRIAAPTLIIWGEFDRIVPVEHAELFREAIPGARALVLRGAAHNAMVDRAEAFNEAVRGFLQGEAVGE